jgi:hypothetical protein
VFTGPLPSDRRPSVAWACVTGMRLPTRCLAMGVHVTVFNYLNETRLLNIDWIIVALDEF